MRSSILSALVLASVGCAAERADLDVDPGSPTADVEAPVLEDLGGTGDDHGSMPVEPGLRLRAVFGDGDLTLPDVPFPDKLAVYFRIFGTATSADVVDSDYVFQVVDLAGKLLSTDDAACRRFHLNQFGRIDEVYTGVDASGAPCTHEFGIADNFSLLPQLFPFGDAPIVDGLMHYRIEVFPVGDKPSTYSLSAPFSVVAPVEEPSCGNGKVEDGEACDDGNAYDHDGCTTRCTLDECPVQR